MTSGLDANEVTGGALDEEILASLGSDVVDGRLRALERNAVS
jgi:hypothetical protein